MRNVLSVYFSLFPGILSSLSLVEENKKLWHSLPQNHEVYQTVSSIKWQGCVFPIQVPPRIVALPPYVTIQWNAEYTRHRRTQCQCYWFAVHLLRCGRQLPVSPKLSSCGGTFQNHCVNVYLRGINQAICSTVKIIDKKKAISTKQKRCWQGGRLVLLLAGVLHFKFILLHFSRE